MVVTISLSPCAPDLHLTPSRLSGSITLRFPAHRSLPYRADPNAKSFFLARFFLHGRKAPSFWQKVTPRISVAGPFYLLHFPTAATSGSCNQAHGSCSWMPFLNFAFCITTPIALFPFLFFCIFFLDNQLTDLASAKQATCSCGKQSALHCTCDKANSENAVEGPRCSCRARPAGQCTCDRASAENQKPTGNACACGTRPAGKHRFPLEQRGMT